MFNPKNYGLWGDNVAISLDSKITKPQNVYFYGNNSIKSAIILSNSAKVILKKNSFSSYGLRISTADHARIVGIPCIEVRDDIKPQGMGHDVIVEEDVWMGFNVTILNGVTIGRGTTVASGAVVNKTMPPYCICGGIPAKFIKFYWTIDQIIEHESKVYSEEERFSRTLLENIFKKYNK